MPLRSVNLTLNQSTNDDVKNTKESIYSPKAALERRIEIQEVIFHE